MISRWVAGVGAVAAALAGASVALGAPVRVPYAGELRQGGTPYDGAVDVQAALYAQPNPTLLVELPVWPQSTGAAPWSYGAVSVQDGIFTIDLGDPADPLDSSVLSGFPGGLWLVVWIDGEPALPAQAVLSVPYALVAADAHRLGGLDASQYALLSQLHPVALSGQYSSLTGTPNLHPVATSGQYSSLTGTPNLHPVATSGDYNQLNNTPNLHPVATSGDYNQLNNTPNLHPVATSGQYSSLFGTPNLHPVATSGDYNQLNNTPNLSSYTTGSGQSGYVTRWTGAQSLGSSALFQSGSRIGLGTTTPEGILDVRFTENGNGVVVESTSVGPNAGRSGVRATTGVTSSLASGMTDSGMSSSSAYHLQQRYYGSWAKTTVESIGAGCCGGESRAFGGHFELAAPEEGAMAISGTKYLGGVGGFLTGAINGTPSGAVAAVMGVDESTGSAPSWAGYFLGDVNIVGNLTITGTLSGGGVSGLHPVAYSGAYSDLVGTPSLHPVATSGQYSALSGTPNLHPVATSGNYNDLNNKPNLHPVATSGQYSSLSGTPNLHAVATSGNYNDLINRPNLSNFATAAGSNGYLARFTSATNLNSSGLFQSGSQLSLGSTTPLGSYFLTADLLQSNSGGFAAFDQPITGKNGRGGFFTEFDINATACCSNGGSGTTQAGAKVRGWMGTISLYDAGRRAAGVRGDAEVRSINGSTAFNNTFGDYMAGGVFFMRPHEEVSTASLTNAVMAGAVVARLEGSYSTSNIQYPLSAVLGVNTSPSANTYAGYFHGNLGVSGNALKPGGGLWATLSDERLKDVEAPFLAGLREIEQLEPIAYRYREGNALSLPSDTTFYGYLAQQVQRILPEAVRQREDGYLELNGEPILLALVNAIQELSHDNRALEQQVLDQQDRIDTLEARLDALQRQVEALAARR